MMAKGMVYFPRHENSWRPTYEGELLAWTGDEDETADQIDVSSMAAIVCEAGNMIRPTFASRPLTINPYGGRVLPVKNYTLWN